MRTRTVVLAGALTGALAASTLLGAPAMADTTPEPAVPAQAGTPAPEQTRAAVRFRNSCNPTRATLPGTVEGMPAGFVAGAAKGLYIWHERAGWRVRLTHPQTDDPKLIEVRGRITSTRKFAKVRTIRLEDKQRGEWVRTRNKVMTFRFVNGGFIDGINFTAHCSGRLAFTAWEVRRDAAGRLVRDASGRIERTPLPILVGSAPMPVTTESVPALAARAPADVSRVLILRSPVARAS